MKISNVSHFTSVKSEANRWSAQDDLILELLVGTHTYQQIALRLGRSAGSVQLRASRKGLAFRADEGESKKRRKELAEERRNAALRASEEDLAEFLPECSEPPVLPHAGGTEYHRIYKQKQRSRLKAVDNCEDVT